MFDQLNYGLPGYKLELKGVENVEGANCYKLIVTDPKGEVATEYYDVKSGLLNRSVQANDKSTMTMDYKNYKSVDGIMLPYTVAISGVMPITLVMEATNMTVNKELPADIFKVE